MKCESLWWQIQSISLNQQNQSHSPNYWNPSNDYDIIWKMGLGILAIKASVGTMREKYLWLPGHFDDQHCDTCSVHDGPFFIPWFCSSTQAQAAASTFRSRLPTGFIQLWPKSQNPALRTLRVRLRHSENTDALTQLSTLWAHMSRTVSMSPNPWLCVCPRARLSMLLRSGQWESSALLWITTPCNGHYRKTCIWKSTPWPRQKRH